MSNVLLTSVENVKNYLGINSVTDDALLERLVNSCSDYIQSWLNRSLGTQTYTDVFDGMGGQSYMFYAFPVTAIQSLKVNELDIPAAPDSKSAGYAFADRRLIVRGYYFAHGMMNCEVVYTAGFDTVPHEIEQACIEMIAARYKEKDRIGLASKGLAGETISFSQKDMAESTKTILKNYRKVVPT